MYIYMSHGKFHLTSSWRDWNHAASNQRKYTDVSDVAALSEMKQVGSLVRACEAQRKKTLEWRWEHNGDSQPEEYLQSSLQRHREAADILIAIDASKTSDSNILVK